MTKILTKEDYHKYKNIFEMSAKYNTDYNKPCKMTQTSYQRAVDLLQQNNPSINRYIASYGYFDLQNAVNVGSNKTVSLLLSDARFTSEQISAAFYFACNTADRKRAFILLEDSRCNPFYTTATGEGADGTTYYSSSLEAANDYKLADVISKILENKNFDPSQNDNKLIKNLDKNPALSHIVTLLEADPRIGKDWRDWIKIGNM